MKHSVRETGPAQRTLDIEVPLEEVEAHLDRAARELQRRAVMPGFRKGKVPLDRVRQDFASQIEHEFLERAIPRVTAEALEAASLSPVIPPYVHHVSFQPGQPLRFEAVVDLAPEIEVRDWQGLPAVRRVRAIADAEIERVIGELREDAAIFVDVDRAAEKGDVVLLDSQRLDANGRRLANTRAKNTRGRLGAPDLLPDLEAGLMGAREGQERTLTVTYPDDHRQTEVAGKTLRYVVKVRKIQHKKLRELDDNFARELFQLDSLAALRDRVRQNLEAEDAARVRREVEGQVLEELLRRNPFELSERLVAYLLDQVVREQTGGREIAEDLRKQLDGHYRPGVERSIRREILLGAVARQEALAVSPEEITAEIERMAAADPKQAARVRARYQSADRRRALGESVLERKAMDRIIEKAALKEEAMPEPVSA